jgi:ABC-2 type transport system ATP-binding protein
MVNSPELLLLDEPTVHLDPIGVKLLRDYLKDLSNNGTAIVLATHQLDIAERIADQILIINEGAKVFQGTMLQLRNSFDDVSEEDTLENFYEKLIQN